MRKRVSFIKLTKLWGIIFLAGIGISIIAVDIIGSYRDFNFRANQMRTDYIASQKQIIKQEVHRVVDLISYEKAQSEKLTRDKIKSRVYEAYAIARDTYQNNKNAKNKSEIQNMILGILRSIRFENETGYYFVIRMDGMVMLNANKPELEGKNLLDLQDTHGKNFIKEMIKIAKQSGEGFDEYYWVRPGVEGDNFKKISFIKIFKPYNWIIGTGLYVDDVKEQIKKDLLSTISRIRFGKEGYIFINRLNGDALVSNGKLFSGTKKLWEVFIKNPKKMKDVFEKEYNAALKPEGDYIYYSHIKLTNPNKESPKASFVYGIPDMQWLVGAGVYLDDVEADIALSQTKLNDQIKAKMLYFISIVMGIVALFFLFFNWMSRGLKNDFKLFVSFFKRAAHSNEKINRKLIKFVELDQIAEYANKMLKDRNQAEEGLRESEELYREFIEGTDDLVTIVNKDLKFAFVNQMSNKIFGLPPRDCIGQSAFKFIHPDDREPTRNWFDDIVAANKTSGTIENRQIGQTGEIHYMRWTSNFHYDSYGNLIKAHGIANDITEKKRAEEALRESESRYSALFTGITDAVLVHHITEGGGPGKVIDANEVACKMLGYTRDELIGMGISDIDAPESTVDVHRIVEDLRVGQNILFEQIQMTKDGRRIPVEVHAQTIDYKGRLAILSTVRDITDRKKAEEAVRESEKKYRHLFETAMVGMYRTKLEDGKFLAANKSLARMMGYDSVDIFIEEYVTSEHYADPKRRKELLNKLQSDGKVENFEIEMKRVDGSHIQIALSATVYAEHGYLEGIVIDITKRKCAEKALRESEMKYRNFIENAPVGMYTLNTEGKFTYGNKKLLEITGYKAEDWLNKPFHPIVHPDDLEIVLEKVGKRLAGKGTTDPYEIRIINSSGEILWIKITAQTIFDTDGKGVKKPVGIQSFVEEITDRKQVEEALRESEEKYRSIFENAIEGFFQSTPEGRFVSVNPSFAKMLGYESPEDLLSTISNVSEQYYVDPEDRNRYQQLLQKDGRVENFEFKVRRKDGSQIWVSNSTRAYFDKEDKIVRYEGIVIDISERKRVEKEKAELQFQLLQAHKMESIGNLAGGIAHDFNNILSAILGYTELSLEDVEKGTPIENNLQEVYTAGKRARDLVKQILAFARQTDEELKPIRVDKITMEVLKLIRSTIPATIEIRHKVESNSLIMGSTTQVHQIFVNLCTNAAQAMDDTGGMLEVGLADIKLDAKSPLTQSGLRPGNYLKATISDTGPGISPDIIDSIFEPYFTTKGVGEGTGMGLAMVHGIVESYGGKVAVETELGKGTVFSIYLPTTQKRDGYRPYEAEDLPHGTECILLVDDELPIAKMNSRILERLGYRVIIRTSSVEALELFRSKPSAFDLIITDMTMPNMTGDALAMELIALRSDIPVILCTGYSKKISDEKVSQIGIKAFAYKPIVKADLAKKVRKVLDEAKDCNFSNESKNNYR